MKIRTVIIFFNLILAAFIAILILIPAIILGMEPALEFWQKNWYLVLVLSVILIGFDTYFIINRRLFSLLEKEDWPALVHYLEEIVLRRGHYRPYLVKLLANTYLVLSDTASVLNLENKTAVLKPNLVSANVLVFGTARILSRDFAGAERFFENHKSGVKQEQLPWTRWYYGFTLILNRNYEKGADEFISLAKGCQDGIITALSAYFLRENIAKLLLLRETEMLNASAEGALRVKKMIPKHSAWIRETERLNTEIHAATLAKYLEECGNWLYNQDNYESD